MKVCFLGYPNQNYSRYKILIKGLRLNNVKVVFCTDKSSLAPIRYLKLWLKFYQSGSSCDVIFVPFPGQINMPIAWILGKIFKKKVVYDAFVSLFDNYLYDRCTIKPGSLKAYFYWWLDRLACILADAITHDTTSHIKYFVKIFKLNPNKFHYLPVGGDDSVFRPKSNIKNLPAPACAGRQTGQKPLRPRSGRAKIIVEFHGMFTRLHGAEIFVKAAKKLEHKKQLEFWLIGDSHNFRLPIELFYKLKPKTMKYFGRISERQLVSKIQAADICIGHLGPTRKAQVVATNKMYQALACKKALIAPLCPASKEFLSDKKNCLMVKMYNQKDLLKKILLLARNQKLHSKIAANGHLLHQQKFSNKILGEKLKQILSASISEKTP